MRPGRAGPLLLVLNSSGNIYYSANGLDWTGPIATGLSVGNGIVFTNGRFVAVGQDGSNYGAVTSSDGITWTKQNLGGTAAQLTKISLDSTGKILATGYYGITYETFLSPDGLVWTGPFSTGIPNAVGPVWSGNAFFISSSNGASWKKSIAGDTWDGTGLGSTSMYQANSIGSLGGRIVLGGGAPAGANKQVSVSADGGLTFSATSGVNTAAGYIYAFLGDSVTGRLFSLGSGPSAQVNYNDNFGTAWTASSGTGTGRLQGGG